MSAFSNYGKYCREHRAFGNIFYYFFFVIGIILLFIIPPLGAGIMYAAYSSYKEDEGKPYG